MSSSPRGYAVVITMAKGRVGADVDERDIAELFQQLDFEVIKLKDKTREVLSMIRCRISLFVCKSSGLVLS